METPRGETHLCRAQETVCELHESYYVALCFRPYLLAQVLVVPAQPRPSRPR